LLEPGCGPCRARRRAELDRRLLRSESVHVLSRIFGYSEESLLQHRNHLKGKKMSKEYPEGHIFTRQEIASMSREEYEKNREKILEQMSKGQIE
jgi:hypothetical protein